MDSKSRIISLKSSPELKPVQEPSTPAPRRRQRSRIRFYAATVLVVLISCVIAWWMWPTKKLPEGAIPSETISNASEVDSGVDIVSRVNELIVLPQGEEPTIATVTDPEKLRDQVFFANAKEGDAVLIYTKAQKAYLYDPAAHKLIEVAPLTIQ